LSLVDHGRTGFLVNDRDPEQFATYTEHLLSNPGLAAGMRAVAADRGRRYTWSFAAARLRRVYTDITSRSLVNCS
jgi:glycosyltransferase involved in cell wall biosynthesis